VSIIPGPNWIASKEQQSRVKKKYGEQASSPKRKTPTSSRGGDWKDSLSTHLIDLSRALGAKGKKNTPRETPGTR